MNARAPILVGFLLLAFAAPIAASAKIPDDAYEVSAEHDEYGSVLGYLKMAPYRAELWLSGPWLISFYASFTFPCDSYGESLIVVEECSGTQGKRFAGAYTVDADGEASGFAIGAGQMYGFELRANGHT